MSVLVCVTQVLEGRESDQIRAVNHPASFASPEVYKSSVLEDGIRTREPFVFHLIHTYL